MSDSMSIKESLEEAQVVGKPYAGGNAIVGSCIDPSSLPPSLPPLLNGGTL